MIKGTRHRSIHLLVILGLALFLISCTPPVQLVEAAGASALPKDQLKVITWNIEWFPGRTNKTPSHEDAQKHIRQVQQALKTMDPDILLLQEMRDLESVEKAVSVLPGYQVHIVSRFKQGFAVGRHQLAIASRLPADAAFAEEWKRAPDQPPRGFAFAALQVPGGHLLVYSLHLKSNAGGAPAENIAKREESARQLMAHVRDMEKIYRARGRTGVIIGGDFNVLETEPYRKEQTFSLLKKEGFFWTFSGVPFNRRVTWPAKGRYPDASFDHIFIRDLPQVQAKVLNRFDHISDHRPVQVIVPGRAAAN